MAHENERHVITAPDGSRFIVTTVIRKGVLRIRVYLADPIASDDSNSVPMMAKDFPWPWRK